MIHTTRVTAERIKQYLKEGKRFDGRKPENYRKIEIEKGISAHAEGSARVKIGKTEVIVGIKMSVGEPYPDSPDKGNLITTAELIPLSSPRIELGPPKFNSIEIGRLVDRMLRESGFIDFKGLCIKEGEKVWTLFVDIYSINDDGNLLDAAAIGAIIALFDTKIPKYDEESDKILYEEPTDEKLPLSKEFPLSITIHKIGDYFIVDPTKEEEDISETRVTIGGYEEIVSSMQKGMEKSLNIEEMLKVLEISKKVNQKLRKEIEKYI